MSKIWFITGAGRGFGKEFAQAALSRGDRVAATVRKLGDVDDLVAAFGTSPSRPTATDSHSPGLP